MKPPAPPAPPAAPPGGTGGNNNGGGGGRRPPSPINFSADYNKPRGTNPSRPSGTGSSAGLPSTVPPANAGAGVPPSGAGASSGSSSKPSGFTSFFNWMSGKSSASASASSSSYVPPANAGAGLPPSGAGAGSHGGGSSGRPPSPTMFAPGSLPSNPAFDRDKITKGFQDHHIISDTNKLTKDHPLLKLAGFDLQSRANKIFLPSDESLHDTRSIHIGRHTTDSMGDVKRKMDGILRLGEANGWNQTQYRAALDDMLGGLRTELKAGDIALNKKARSWAFWK